MIGVGADREAGEPRHLPAEREQTELRLRETPCRWQIYCAECVVEMVCSTLLIIVVYTEGSFLEDGSDASRETLKDLYLVIGASALKYVTMRLAPLLLVGGLARWPSELGEVSEWGRLAARRRYIHARAWCIPAAAVTCALLAMAVLLFSEVHGFVFIITTTLTVHGLVAVHISAVLVANVAMAAESLAAAALGHRRGYREVFPEMEIIKPMRYRDLARSCPKCSPSCAICLQEFVPQDSAVRLPCGHVFHAECAGEWISRGHGCPYRCRHVAAHLAWDPPKDNGR